MWFKSIEISKELQYQYEYETFEYEKVADILVWNQFNKYQTIDIILIEHQIIDIILIEHQIIDIILIDHQIMIK